MRTSVFLSHTPYNHLNNYTAKFKFKQVNNQLNKMLFLLTESLQLGQIFEVNID